MTIKTAIAAFSLIGAFAASPAFAAVNDGQGYEPAFDEPECVFVAETGGYQCETETYDVARSLSDLDEGNAKKKLKLPPVIIVIGP